MNIQMYSCKTITSTSPSDPVCFCVCPQGGESSNKMDARSRQSVGPAAGSATPTGQTAPPMVSESPADAHLSVYIWLAYASSHRPGRPAAPQLVGQLGVGRPTPQASPPRCRQKHFVRRGLMHTRGLYICPLTASRPELMAPANDSRTKGVCAKGWRRACHFSWPLAPRTPFIISANTSIHAGDFPLHLLFYSLSVPNEQQPGPRSPPALFAYGESIESIILRPPKPTVNTIIVYRNALLCIQMMLGEQVKLVAWQVTRFFIRKGMLQRVVAVLWLVNWIW